MSYVALYRKFRPQTFEDVKGQDHIVTALQNQIRADRLGHAYLFTGTRGTGKTTVAKILAKAVNCEHPVEGSPCNACASCRSINEGNSMNVFEIDAASNNGVQNIRDIIEEVAYAPTSGRYKVYIIDEVHMLSAGAFAALLKTLEEPPAYVIFILATTEVHKIPITILSRCQRYDFRRISIDTIAARLRELMDQEQISVEEKALRYVAKAGDGSMRDALSLLDQCIAFYLGQELTYDRVLQVLGAVDNAVFSQLLRCILQRDVTGSIALLEEMVVKGRDLNQFVIDFTWYLRNLMLVKSDTDMEDVLEVTSEHMALLKEEAGMVDNETLMRFIRIFSELANQIRYSSQKRVLIEIALVKLCRPQMEQDYEAVLDRLSVVEEKLEEGVPVAATSAATGSAGASAGAAKPAVTMRKIPDAMPEEVEQLCRNWKQIQAVATGPLRLALMAAYPTVNERGEMTLVYDEPPGSKSIQSSLLTDDENLRQELQELIREQIGKQVTVNVQVNRSQVSGSKLYENAVEHFAKAAKIELDEEDF
jgi:DNA polymerase-3 subunit gamma/tau